MLVYMKVNMEWFDTFSIKLFNIKHHKNLELIMLLHIKRCTHL